MWASMPRILAASETAPAWFPDECVTTPCTKARLLNTLMKSTILLHWQGLTRPHPFGSFVREAEDSVARSPELEGSTSLKYLAFEK
jgi:hypothetical protein